MVLCKQRAWVSRSKSSTVLTTTECTIFAGYAAARCPQCAGGPILEIQFLNQKLFHTGIEARELVMIVGAILCSCTC